jgi:hypothetical protein
MRPESAARRARVLRYPDLAKKLTQPPLGYSRPEAWNGWVPPAALEVEACPACRTDPGKWGCKGPMHTARLNSSARRTALVEIAAEALRREQAEQAQQPPDGGPDGV